MKAYMIFDFDPMDGCLLVFAKTASKARQSGFGFWTGDSEYIDMRAIRKKEYDKFYVEGVTRTIMHDNSDLPEGAPMFFSEQDYD